MQWGAYLLTEIPNKCESKSRENFETQVTSEQETYQTIDWKKKGDWVRYVTEW